MQVRRLILAVMVLVCGQVNVTEPAKQDIEWKLKRL